MKKNQLKTGVILSYVNLLIGNLLPFIYTPIMLRMLGQAEYGIYGIAQSIMGYLQLLNFGIGGSIVRYLAKYRAEGDKEGEEKIFGLFVKIYTVIGIVMFLTGFGLACSLNSYSRSMSVEELALLKQLVQLMTLNCALFMPFSVYTSMIIAHEEFILQKLVAMLTSIASPLCNLFFLYLGQGAIGFVLVSIGFNVLTYIIYVYYVQCRLYIKPRFEKINCGILKEILVYSAYIFLGLIVDTLYWATDKLIIGWAIGSVATAVYNIGSSFNGYITSLSTAVSSVLIPKLTGMVVKDVAKEEFSELFIKIGRLQFIIISFIISAFVAFGRQFIELWVGKEYASAYAVALFTMIPVTVPLIQNTGLNILYATNKHRFRSIVYACVAVLNVLLTFWWVEDFGIIGAAAATCVAYIIGNILIINWYYYKKIGINIPLFWHNILKMCPVMLIMGTTFYFILNVITINSWLKFFGLAVIYSCIYMALAYCFMMNQYEKDIVMVPAKKILKKIRVL